MTNIQQTENYSLFKRITGNRTINKAQVNKLYTSFGERPELASAVPIIVNDKMEIIDGQHRFEALKKLNLPIAYFVIKGLNLSDVQAINSSTKNWSPVDYAKSFSTLGNKDYKIYLEFKEKYGLDHFTLITYLEGDEHNTSALFKKGKFKANKDIEKAHRICSQLVDVQEYYKRGRTMVFAIAFKKCALSPQYDHKRMMEKLKLYINLLKDTPYAEDYMRQLEKIYNHRCGIANRTKLF